jgi:hypothetical protein
MRQELNRLKSIIARVIALILVSSMLVAVNPSLAVAWDQQPVYYKAHQEINNQALLKFIRENANNTKYANSPVDRNKLFMGPQVTSNGMLADRHLVDFKQNSFENWTIHGGYSADEPNLWASVRHFYNPRSDVGPPQLTDIQWGWQGVAGYTAISAFVWAFVDPANPFSWRKALEYYKKSMEISDDDTAAQNVPGTDFRDPGIYCSTLSAQRDVYLGKAFRSLGETMHMMADMTQPAHTRNDAHPSFDIDPLEAVVRDSTVYIVKDYPVESGINSEIDKANDAKAMFVRVAYFSNRNFYTDDTIYDSTSGVLPRNGENPFPSPQFSELDADPLVPASSSPTMYGKKFDGKFVPLIEQSGSDYTGDAPGKQWHVPMAFGLDQAAVLLPIAIKANSRLIDLFFPTIDLKIKGTKSTSNDPGNRSRQEFEITGLMKHAIENDVEWKSIGEIMYSGPAELWSTSGHRLAEDIQFKQGALKKRLLVFTDPVINTASRTPDVDRFPVADGDNVWMVVKAGGRTFTSNKFSIASCGITIQPEALDAETGKAYTFSARPGSVPANPNYTWKIDGREVQNGPNNTLIVTFKAEGSSTVSVTLRDGDRECMDTARVTISSSVQPLPPTPPAVQPLPPAPPTPKPPPPAASPKVTGVAIGAGESHNGVQCPFTGQAVGTIFVENGPGTVTYQWELQEGGSTPIASETFDSQTFITIVKPLTRTTSGSTYIRVHVLTPNDVYSKWCSMVVYCR